MKIVLAAFGALWVGGLGFGANEIWRYTTTPGAVEPHPAHWPSESSLRAPADRPLLVMFVHPRCPCSRASMAELNQIMGPMRGKVDAEIVFLRPSAADETWTQSDTWKRAHEIPGAQVIADLDGQEAARFGAKTSGQVLLYDAASELRFAGGITASRGHQGDNAGRRTVVALIEKASAQGGPTSVFGCPLAESEDASE